MMNVHTEHAEQKGPTSTIEGISTEYDGLEEEDERSPTEIETDLEESDFFWLERLLSEPVGLRPDQYFIARIADQRRSINENEFCRRFREFIRGWTGHEPDLQIVEKLFSLAVLAKQEVSAWEDTIRATKRKNFVRSLKFLQARANWLARMRRILRKQFRGAPAWTSTWESIWLKACDELLDVTQAQLRDAQHYLENVAKLAKLGRTDIRSHVLLLNGAEVREAVRRSPLSRTPLVAIAAFAYASELVPYTDDADDPIGKYVDKVKARLSRTRASKADVQISSTLLQSMLR
jgi:hypothetical protein